MNEQGVIKRTRSVIRDEAYEAWVKSEYHGLIGNCTGSGKSSIGIKAAEQCYLEYKSQHKLKELKILLVTYTIVAGKVDWPDEFKKWKQAKLLKYIKFVCYASLHSIPKDKYALVILDEAHHMTDKAYGFFNGNRQSRILMLTATPPDDKKEMEKVLLLNRLGPIVYTYKLDEGISDGNLSDYQLWIVDSPLDDTHAYIKAGNKNKGYYFVTEKVRYDYLTSLLIIAQRKGNYKWAEAIRNQRMHFLNNLASVTVVARKVLAKLNPDKRIVVFASSKDQCSKLAEEKYIYHSGMDESALKNFRTGKHNLIISVRKINESVNIKDTDDAVVTSTYSNERDIIQRMGRMLRFRPDHTAKIFLIRVPDTVNENWVADAISSLDPSKIFYYHSSRLNS